MIKKLYNSRRRDVGYFLVSFSGLAELLLLILQHGVA